jgi:hypothetical protein
MTLFLGLLLGFAREFSVVRYLKAVQARSALLGSVLTLGIGCLDLVVIARLALEGDLRMAIGFLIGETLASYFAIKAKHE